MQTQTTPALGPPAPTPAGPDALEQWRRALAVERIRRKAAFRLQLAVYLAVNALFVVVWAATGAGFFWPIFPILAWGGVLAIHGVLAQYGDSVTQAQIERELKRLS